MNVDRIEQQYAELENKSISDFSDKDWNIWHIHSDLREDKELKRLPKNTTIYTVLRSVSKSGMQRVIDMFYIQDNRPVRITYATNKVFSLGAWDSDKSGFKVRGCGMDMGFHLVYSLSSHLFGDGYYLNHQWF